MLPIFGVLELLIQVHLQALILHAGGIDFCLGRLAHPNIGTFYELLHVLRSLLGCCVLLELSELLDEVLTPLALENDAEDELYQDE